MHELSLAQNIIDSIRENVAVEKLPMVRSVKVKIGEGSGVVPDSLIFAFDAIVQDTVLSSSRIKPVIIPFTVRCKDCHKDSVNGSGEMICSNCDSMNVKIISGTELIVHQIELVD